MPQTIKRAVPWVISLALLAYIGWTTDFARAWDALQRADITRFLVVLFVGVALGYLWDSLSLTLLFRRFNARVSFREILLLKGASYLLNIINYNAAMGGMALYLRRVRRIDILESASSLLYMNALDIFALCGLTGLGIAIGGGNLEAVLSVEAQRGLLWIVLAFAALLAGTLLYWNAGWNFLVFGRLRGLRIFHAFRLARVVDYLWLMAVRTVLLLLYVTFAWQFAASFDIHIPFGTILVLQPIIILVGTIPISVAGLGTTQVVMRMLYSPFAAYLVLSPLLPKLAGTGATLVGAAGHAGAEGMAAVQGGAVLAAEAYVNTTPLIDTMSTATIVSVVLVRVVIGNVCLAKISRALIAPPEHEDRPSA